MCCKSPHVPKSTTAALAEKLTALALDLAHHRRRPDSPFLLLGVGALDVSSDALRRLEGRGAIGAAGGCGQSSALGCVIIISAFYCLCEEGNFTQLGNI